MWKRILIILCFSVLAQCILGQNQTTLWFQSPTSLPNYAPSYNYFVYHDSEGFVWISSTAGLNRFDGRRVKHYHSIPGDSTTMADDNIQEIFLEDGNHDLWLSAEAIHRYQRKTDDFKQYYPKLNDGAITADYRAFFIEKDSFIWFRARQGIYRFNIYEPSQVDSFGMTEAFRCRADTASDGSVQFVYGIGETQQSNHFYWEIDHGKFKKKWKWFDNCPHPIPQNIKSVYTENDVTWLGTNIGLVKWNRKNGGSYELIGGKAFKNCIFAPWDSKYLIVMTSAMGLFQFDKDTKKFIGFDIRALDGKKISPQSFYNLFIDRHGNLWVSDNDSGVLYANLRKSKFGTLPKAGIPSRDNTSYGYWCFENDQTGNLWYGTKSGLFKINSNGKLLKYIDSGDSKNKLPSSWVTSFLLDDPQNAVVGTWIGLSHYTITTNKFQPILGESGSPDSSYIVHICKLSSGDVLASSNNNGIQLLKRTQGSYQSHLATQPESSFTIIYEDKKGNIYASNDDQSIDVFKLAGDTLILTAILPFKGSVFSYHGEPEGKKLWVGSLSGLAKIDLESKTIDTIYTEKDGLPDKSIHSMLASDANTLWLGTPKGLVRFLIKEQKFQTFSLADGTQSSEFYLNAAIKRPNGELWFGGSNGITIVRPDALSFLENKPIAKITGIKINDLNWAGLADSKTGATNITQIKHLDLDYGDNTLSFEFVAIEYSDPSNNQLRYMLKGADDHWLELEKGELGFARYPKLPHNNYTLVIQAANSDGVWGDPIEALQITINPHWTNTWWFKISLACFIGLLAWLIIRYRIAQIREKADLNTRVAENKMAALRSQMNPHFVFNSLQTVNGFIAKQDLRGAMEYINQFARLMRVILENSREGQISLEREIELLELYMKIESRRFGTPFTYTINVGDNVDTYSMEIPSMLLQPFVENAIKHGLFHKKDGGHINIAFVQENKSLKCVVEDNGVGRAKTAELNTQQGRGHKSRGLQIVNERLAIIRAANPGNYDVKISDLFDRQQNPSGTRVEITLPLS